MREGPFIGSVIPPARTVGGGAGQWSVRISDNWRVVFRFEHGEAVDLIDCH